MRCFHEKAGEKKTIKYRKKSTLLNTYRIVTWMRRMRDDISKKK